MNTRFHEAARISLTGDRRENQDRCVVLDSGATILLAVADGLGGHPRGGVAAQLFIDTCEYLLRHAEQPLADPRRFIHECIHRAHHAIVRFGDRQDPPISPRSTAVILLVQEGRAQWAHVGDSRLYLIREGDVLVQTHDHSQVRAIDSGPRPEGGGRSAITRCLGGLDQPPEISFGIPMQLKDGDTLLLCTDGLWDQVPRRELIRLLSHADLSSGLRQAGVLAARHPRSDNVTGVALRWGASSGSARRGSGSTPRFSDPLDDGLRRLREERPRKGLRHP